MDRSGLWTAALWVAASIGAAGCLGPVDERAPGGAALGASVETVKGGSLLDEGGGAACGPDRLEVLARTWDALPFAAGSDIYQRVDVALVPRASGSVTDWTVDPIRVEVAQYSSCDTIAMAMIHELGHALRALYLDRDDEFPAGEVDLATGRARADEWAVLLGTASWDDLGPAATASCGSDADHCAFATDELFAEMVRSLYFPAEGSDAASWCKGRTPCWIYDFYSAFPDPRTIPGLREWMSGLTEPRLAE